jgi:hypothetical protein
MRFAKSDFANGAAVFADMGFEGYMQAGRAAAARVGGTIQPPVMCKTWSGDPGPD